MKKSLLIILSLLCALGLASCKKAEDSVTPEELCFDIQRIQSDMAYSALRELYDPEPFEQLKADVMAGKADQLDCFYRIREIIRAYKCAHLNLQPNDSSVLYSKILPFTFYCFGNDYHIYLATSSYQKYLGWKLIKIGGQSVEDAREKLCNYAAYPYETVSGEKYVFDSTQSYTNYKAAGLVQKNGKINFTIESPDGKIKTLSCHAIRPSYFIKWVKIAPEKENKLLMHNNKSRKYAVATSPEKQTIYVQYNDCMEDENYICQKWFEDIISELNTGKYNTVVFDVRYNPGGYGSMEFMINNEFWRYKSEFDKYNLALVISGRTYSCATWFTNDLLRNFPHVKIFGEETGQAVFNYTNVPIINKLKKLNCNFNFPKQLDEVPELYKRAAEVTHSDVHRGTLPDVEVYEKFEDFMKGEDTIYNAIYDYFN